MITQGIYTALVTPFTQSLTIDTEALHRLLSIQKKSSVSGIVLGGTTGESATLTLDEIVVLVKESESYHIPTIVGIGSANTAYSQELAKRLSPLSIDAFLLVLPYYNKPTQEGMFQHVKAVLEVSEKPILLYNVPARTGSSITPETVARLHDAFPEKIIGIKEASANMLSFTRLRSLCGERFLIFTGDDATLYPALAVGANGSISVLSNILPQSTMELFTAYQNNEYKKAASLHSNIQHIVDLLFIESNPIPIKYMLSYLGIIRGYVRLPLVQLSEKFQQEVAIYLDTQLSEDIRVLL